LMRDCPAWRPSPLSNVIVIVGPRLENVSQAIHAPIRSVTAGISQISG
jgi:hypothetical protein